MMRSESFKSTIHFIYQNPNNVAVLLAVGVRDWNIRWMIADFERQQSFRPEKTRACFYTILSFSPLDQPDDAQLERIALDYLAAMGLTNTQYVVIKRVGKIPLHLHVIANMVDNEGKGISSSWMGLNGKRVAQRLTKTYGLTVADKKDLAQTNLEALDVLDSDRYQIYLAIYSILPFCKTLEELIARLKEQGVEALIRCKPGSDEPIGISFKIGKNCFKGSKVDQAFSLYQLTKKLKDSITY